MNHPSPMQPTLDAAYTAAQAARFQEQAERIQELERELHWAEQHGDMWQRSAEAMQEHLEDGARIGITVDGHVGVVVDEQVWNPS